MRILIGEFIEFGEFVKDGDSYELSIVHGWYEFKDMTEEELNETTYDWIDLDKYQGEIVYNQGATA